MGTAPLVTALTGHIAREARRIAATRPGGRLDPPLTLALDEAALICPIPLDNWTADMGGRNVTIQESVLLGANYYESAPTRPGKLVPGAPPLGIGDDTVVRRAIVDKNCRIGRGVRIVNERGLREAESDNYVVRDGIVVIPNGAVVPDGAVI